MNKEFFKMQKLAGLITETQFKQLNEAIENISDFLNTNIEEFKTKIADPGSSFEIIGDEKVATAGDDEGGIDVSFDKEHTFKVKSKKYFIDFFKEMNKINK